jgi:hypothetical protein
VRSDSWRYLYINSPSVLLPFLLHHTTSHSPHSTHNNNPPTNQPTPHQLPTCLISGTHHYLVGLYKTSLTACSRKGLGEQVSEKVTPDSQKSTTQKASEGVSGLGDRVAGAVQPGTFYLHPSLHSSSTNTFIIEGNKSATQKLGDSTRSGGDDASAQGKGVLAQAQETLGNAAQSVQDAVSGQQKK